MYNLDEAYLLFRNIINNKNGNNNKEIKNAKILLPVKLE